MGFEQALLQELLLDLLDLDGLHLAAVGGEFAVGLGAEGVSSASGVAVRRAAKSFSSRTVRVRSVSSRLGQVRGSRRAARELAEAGGGFGGGGAGGRGERWRRRRRADRGVAVEVAGDAGGLEAGLARFGGVGGGGGADGGFAGLLDGFEDGLGAPGEAVDLALAAVAEAGALGVVLVEGGVDAAQDGFERDAGLAPGFDQRPVERGEHEDGAAALLEAGLDLGEVVEVVHRGSCELSVLSC